MVVDSVQNLCNKLPHFNVKIFPLLNELDMRINIILKYQKVKIFISVDCCYICMPMPLPDVSFFHLDMWFLIRGNLPSEGNLPFLEG